MRRHVGTAAEEQVDPSLDALVPEADRGSSRYLTFVAVGAGGVGLVSDKSLEDAFAESLLRTAPRRLTRPLDEADGFGVAAAPEVTDGPLASDKSLAVEFAASRRLAAPGGLMRGDADDLPEGADPPASAGGELPSDRSVAVAPVEPRPRNFRRLPDAAPVVAVAALVPPLEDGATLVWPKAAPLRAAAAMKIASLFGMESPVDAKERSAFTWRP